MPRRERPLDAGEGPVLRFAADLRRLRQKAGNPTYRALAGRAHYSAAALSSAAGGRQLPSLAVTLAYVRACEGDTAEWEKRWHAVAAELAAAQAADPEPISGAEAVRPPYVGLAAFQPEDAEVFFGRERVVEELLARLAGQRFLAVFGASGAGKSSLVRAGLLPRINDGTRPAALLLTPGAHPLEECAIHLSRYADMGPGQVHDDLAADRMNLHRMVRRILADRPPTAEIVVVVDQFEEVFTLCTGHAERAAFISALVAAAQAPNSQCRIVVTVRADFYPHCLRHPELLDVLRDASVPLGPMSAAELRQAIVRPAVRAGYTVEGALLATLMTHAHGQAGVLPLLSHVLLETWRRRRGNALTLAAFHAAGGFEGSLDRTAESVYSSFDARGQQLAREIFLRLIALGDGTEDTKRHLLRTELDESPEAAAVLERAAAARLLTLDHNRVELTHEALIRCWPRLAGWLTKDRESLRLLRQLTDATNLWESLGRSPDALYRGTRLAAAREFAERSRGENRPSPLTARERAFLDTSLAAEATESTLARRRVRRLRQLVALLVALLCVAVTAVGYAVRTEETVRRQRDASVARNAAQEAIALRRVKPALAAQLSLAAYRAVPGKETRNALLSTVTSTLSGHTQAVSSLAVSPGGRTLATGGYDRTVRLWNLAGSRPATRHRLTGYADVATAVAFSPDERTLATASRDRTVRLWDMTGRGRPAELATLTGHKDLVFSVAFSPDGQTLATGSYDHTIRLWDIADRARPVRLPALTGHGLNVKPVAFSPNGRLLASGSDDHTVRLWDISETEHPTTVATLTAHEDFVDTVAFSPDGRLLASGSDDRTVRLWDITRPHRPVALSRLMGHADVVTAVVFSPDGRMLATSSEDRTVRLWDITRPGQPTVRAKLTGHTGAVNSVTFTPDGKSIITASADHTAQLWYTGLSRALRRACAQARPAITHRQWDRYLAGLPYRPPCTEEVS